MNVIIPMEQMMNPVLSAGALTAILLFVVMRFVNGPVVVLLMSGYRFFIQRSSGRL